MKRSRKKKSVRARSSGDYGVRDAEVGPEAHLVSDVNLGDDLLRHAPVPAGENRFPSTRNRRRWHVMSDTSPVGDAKLSVEGKEDEGHVAGGGDANDDLDDEADAGHHHGTSVTATQLLEEFHGHGLLHPGIVVSGPKRKLMIYVSSTFTDTEVERTILCESIWPRLRHNFLGVGIDIILVDLRYGVRTDDSSKDHYEWITCERELERCHQESGGLFFLSLQGSKYGYQPLPRAVDAATFEECVEKASASHKSLAESAYEADSNYTNTMYVLRPLESASDSSRKAFYETQSVLVNEVFRNQHVQTSSSSSSSSSNSNSNTHHHHHHHHQNEK